ncbi:MAG TPA: PVC-type heme-binding CxxCH protein [Gemmataceae bacterium]|jgi:putative membrane-bound dehydrogenase-like protein|nr:PVC-type heme-binding CxxCH protein [Gemmataceae bacterium]
MTTVALLLWVQPAFAAEVHSPLTPEQALKEFHVTRSLRVELVASEPDIQSPVDMAFDEHGRLWVVEMRDYPNGPPKGRAPEGRVVILEDKEGKGRYTLTSVFAEGLLFGNGILPWRGGVIVTCAPHILYLSDPKHSGKADRREILFEGFAAQNPQLRVSHPILGIDNWIYVANGLRGGAVKRSGRADRPINISGMDFRFDLVHDRSEAISGMGQYGNTFDDWGHRFVCTNRNHLIPIVMPNHYVVRNPFLAVPEPVRDNQNPGGAARVFPLSKNFTTASYHSGTFTASCGVTVYRGDLLPSEYRGCAFTCEPTGNLVHQELLTADGAGFHGQPAHPGVEFLATRDDWFRPVNLAHGPDGALYVVDMYRAVIEHPDFMPPEVKHRPDLLEGKTKGRIWRIVPEHFVERPPRPQLSKASTEELVKLLAHPNAWWRTTAQRLLLERQDASAIPFLRNLILTTDQPLARAYAARLLENQGALDAKLVLHLLNDPHPRVREQAVQLSEKWLAEDPALQACLLAMASDPDARLRFQVALSLGQWDDDHMLAPLAHTALAGADDHWTRMAVESSVAHRAGKLIVTLCQMKAGLLAQLTPGRLTLLQELAALVGGRRDAAEVGETLAALAAISGHDQVRWQMAGINGLADGMGRRGTQLAAFLQSLPEADRSTAKQADDFMIQAARVASDRRRNLVERLPAIALLAHASWTTAGSVLLNLVRDDQDQQDARLAAVRALAAHGRPEVAPALMKSWPNYTPALRREVTEAMLRQPERMLAFLDEVEAGRVKPRDIDPQRVRQLVNHSRPEIRARAARLLKDALPAARKQVLARYRAALELPGDVERGRVVFQKNCATCHRVAGIGVQVGPDISDTLGKTAAAVLNDILDPNAAIDSNYVNYTVTTKSGKLLTGIIASETGSSLTLKRAENQTDVILRQDIDEIQSTGVSLMPEGVEKSITVQEMADLLKFLKNWRYVQFGVPMVKPGR